MCRSAIRYPPIVTQLAPLNVPNAPPSPVFLSIMDLPVEDPSLPAYTEVVDIVQTEEHRHRDADHLAQKGHCDVDTISPTRFVAVSLIGMLLAVAIIVYTPSQLVMSLPPPFLR